MPWTTVSWEQADAACCALNAGGTCPLDGTGWRLCGASDWGGAWEGPAATSCEWSYAASCTTSQPTTCNGDEHDCDSATSGDEDCSYTTGSAAFPSCRTDWGAGGSIYDLSGNAREWTSTAAGTSIYEMRGGSYRNLEEGRTCGFSFAVAEQTFAHPATGFRCCFY